MKIICNFILSISAGWVLLEFNKVSYVQMYNVFASHQTAWDTEFKPTQSPVALIICIYLNISIELEPLNWINEQCIRELDTW